MVTAHLLWPAIGVTAILVIALATAVAWIRAGREQPEPEQVWVANTDYRDAVPEVATWFRRYRWLQGTLAAGLIVAVAGGAAIAARPMERQVVADRMATRDIVLCLDISGSMTPYDGAVLRMYRELAENFRGERIALSVFNSTSRTVFPLTDDYTLVDQQLQEGIAALDIDLSTADPSSSQMADYLRFSAGTYRSGWGSSLIGDGLANCALLFDGQDTERARSIILATDNAVAGEPIYTLEQANALVTERHITLHGLYGTDGGRETAASREYKEIVEEGDGLFFRADDPAAVRGMVEDVVSHQAVALGAKPRIVIHDRPQVWYGVAVLGVALMLVAAWRVRQ